MSREMKRMMAYDSDSGSEDEEDEREVVDPKKKRGVVFDDDEDSDEDGNDQEDEEDEDEEEDRHQKKRRPVNNHKTEESEDSEEEDSEEDEDDAPNLKDISFADILDLRRRGDTDFGSSDDVKNKQLKSTLDALRKRGKHSNKPPEFSSKSVIALKPLLSKDSTRFKPRDPRFEELSGNYNEDLFKKTYSFISDYRKSEIEDLRSQISKIKDPDEKIKLETHLKKLQQIMANKKRREIEQTRKREWRKKERNQVEEGKKPFFLKKTDFKALALEEKFQDLQKRGGLDTYIAKRQKRRAQKSQKFIPRSRRVIDAAPSSAPPPKRRRN